MQRIQVETGSNVMGAIDALEAATVANEHQGKSERPHALVEGVRSVLQ
jgi:hypothetical protein